MLGEKTHTEIKWVALHFAIRRIGRVGREEGQQLLVRSRLGHRNAQVADMEHRRAAPSVNGATGHGLPFEATSGSAPQHHRSGLPHLARLRQTAKPNTQIQPAEARYK